MRPDQKQRSEKWYAKLKADPERWAKRQAEQRVRNQRHYQANHEEIKKSHKTRYKEKREQILKQASEYNARPETQDHKKEYRKTHREQRRIVDKRYATRHPERIRARNAVSNNRRRASRFGSWTREEWTTLKAHYGNHCLCCKKTEEELIALGRKLVPDHIRPLAEEVPGSNIIDNIQPLCHGRGGCNNKKGAKHIDYRGPIPIPYEPKVTPKQFDIPTD